MKAMVELKEIIDTWNMIEKYNIEYSNGNKSVLVSESDYLKMFNASKNKEYIKNLRKDNGNVMFGKF